MSLLKHLIISIAITIFVAWRFPELNLQMAIPNGSISLTKESASILQLLDG